MGEVSWREASLEWVEGASPVHLTDKLAEIVDVAESTVNSFTLNTFGETESLVAREVRRAEERLAGSSIRLSVEFPSSGESFSRYQSLYSNSLVREEAQMEDIRSIKVNVIDNQFTIFVFSCAGGSNVLASRRSRKLGIQLAWLIVLARTLSWHPPSLPDLEGPKRDMIKSMD